VSDGRERAEPLRIGVIQQPAPGPDTAADLAELYVSRAAEAGAEVSVLPELWNVGYRLPSAADAASPAYRVAAGRAETEFLRRMRILARDLRTAVVVTYLGVTGDTLGNCAALIGADGAVRLTYTKVHVARFAGEEAFTPGARLSAVDLPRPDGGTVRVGLMICYDRVLPEGARTLALDGAEVVLVPNAGPLCANRVAQVGTRSFENQFAIAVVNYPGAPTGGNSLVCDGIAFDDTGSPRDVLRWRTGGEPVTAVVDVALDELRAYRAAQPWGLADRVPAAYRC